EDDQPTHPGTDQPWCHPADQPCGEGGGHGPSGQDGSCDSPVDAFGTEVEEEAETGGDRDQELGGRDRSDHLAQFDPSGDEHAGGGYRSPSAAPGGVDETGKKSER